MVAGETVAVLGAADTPGALPVMAGSDQPEHPIWLRMSTIGEEATDGTAHHGDADLSATYLSITPEHGT